MTTQRSVAVIGCELNFLQPDSKGVEFLGVNPYDGKIF